MAPSMFPDHQARTSVIAASACWGLLDGEFGVEVLHRYQAPMVGGLPVLPFPTRSAEEPKSIARACIAAAA